MGLDRGRHPHRRLTHRRTLWKENLVLEEPRRLGIRDVVRLYSIVQAANRGTYVRFLYDCDGVEVGIAGVARHLEFDGDDIRTGHLIVNDGVSDVPVPIGAVIAAADGAFDPGFRMDAFAS